MIRNVTELADGAVLDADIGIVGAGLAGIDLARQLGRSGIRTVLLESGRLEFDPEIQELARVILAGKRLRTNETDGDISRYLPPMYRGYCRIRQFGGTTNVWTGKWRIFDPWDFEDRPWIPHAGWPITLDDLLPFYEHAARDYGFGDFAAEAGGRFFLGAQQLLLPHGLAPHLFYWERSATRSGTRFFQELRHSSQVDVVLGASASDIVLHDSLRAVREIELRSLDGRRFRLRAAQFALATGGLEAPRLLLAASRQIPAGIGNAHDLVGRFYMDHPKHMQGQLRPGPATRRLLEGLKTEPRPRFGISLAHTGAVQRARGMPNHAIYLRPVYRTRLGPLAHFAVKLGIEQMPNPDSRVHLSPERDALGMPRLVVDWRFTPQDHAALASVQQSLAEAFAASGVGRLQLGPRPLTIDDMMDASHHMGTTRMAADPSRGVVDRDCRVFGVDNLYIASSSVFPTGHAYSPTYTILALARRLAAHLQAQHERNLARPPTARAHAELRTAR